MRLGVVLTGFTVAVALAADLGPEGHHLKVDKLTEDDNKPTSPDMKKPLDPYNEVKITEIKTPAIELHDDYSDTSASNEVTGSFYLAWMAISMITVLEIGDKTFLIAALMAMRQPRIVVFSAAFASLAVMTILLGIVGHVLPTLISPRITKYLASILFVVFGAKLMKEGLEMLKNSGVDEEMAEVEQEISSAAINLNLDSVETGNASTTSATKQTSLLTSTLENFNNLASFVFSPIWIQVFVMTFLGEWGDRLQIATIAMAAGSDYWFVILGAIIGHGFCTAGAVLGGKLLAKRISMRSVTIGGAVAFFLFSVLYFYDAQYGSEA